MLQKEPGGEINRPPMLIGGLGSRAAVHRARLAAQQLLVELNYLHSREPEFYHELLVALNQGRSIRDLLDRMEQLPAAFHPE